MIYNYSLSFVLFVCCPSFLETWIAMGFGTICLPCYIVYLLHLPFYSTHWRGSNIGWIDPCLTWCGWIWHICMWSKLTLTKKTQMLVQNVLASSLLFEIRSPWKNKRLFLKWLLPLVLFKNCTQPSSIKSLFYKITLTDCKLNSAAVLR